MKSMMKKYLFNYTGTVIAEWEHNGKQYEARTYEDYFGYICEYNNGWLCMAGNAAYDYFLGDNWLDLAKRLNIAP